VLHVKGETMTSEELKAGNILVKQIAELTADLQRLKKLREQNHWIRVMTNGGSYVDIAVHRQVRDALIGICERRMQYDLEQLKHTLKEL